MHASAQFLKLVTFDADGTLYADGHHIEHDNQMIRHIISLMRRWGAAGLGRGEGQDACPLHPPRSRLPGWLALSIRHACLPWPPPLLTAAATCPAPPTLQQRARGDSHGCGVPGCPRAL